MGHVVCTANELRALRAAGRCPAHAVLSRLKDVGLLRYRGSCAGRRRANLIPLHAGRRRTASSAGSADEFMNEPPLHIVVCLLVMNFNASVGH